MLRRTKGKTVMTKQLFIALGLVSIAASSMGCEEKTTVRPVRAPVVTETVTVPVAPVVQEKVVVAQPVVQERVVVAQPVVPVVQEKVVVARPVVTEKVVVKPVVPTATVVVH
jgi:hypothetical protein